MRSRLRNAAIRNCLRMTHGYRAAKGPSQIPLSARRSRQADARCGERRVLFAARDDRLRRASRSHGLALGLAPFLERRVQARVRQIARTSPLLLSDANRKRWRQGAAREAERSADPRSDSAAAGWRVEPASRRPDEERAAGRDRRVIFAALVTRKNLHRA